MILYRGTRLNEPLKTFHKTASYTDSLVIAVIYSGVPSDPWSMKKELREAHFVNKSTVHAVEFGFRRLLDLAYLGNHTSLGEILQALQFNSISDFEEVLKIYQYMHNRIIGKAKGGEFKYKVFDEDGEELDDADLPLSIYDPVTLISEAKDEFNADPSIEEAERLVADTYIFVDSPSVQRLAKALGYDGILYFDVCEGCAQAAKNMFGIDIYDEKIGVEEDMGIDNEFVTVHLTYRPFVPGQLLWSRPSREVVQELVG